jgi:hypothetical protein
MVKLSLCLNTTLWWLMCCSILASGVARFESRLGTLSLTLRKNIKYVQVFEKNMLKKGFVHCTTKINRKILASLALLPRQCGTRNTVIMWMEILMITYCSSTKSYWSACALQASNNYILSFEYQILGFKLTNVIFTSTLVPYSGDLPARKHDQPNEI